MQETKDYLILEQLKTDLEEKLNSINGYDTDVLEVKVGDFIWEDMKVRPSISILADVGEVEEKLLGNTYIRNTHILVNMYMNNAPGMKEFEDIYKFRDDVESFLFRSTDWTYQEDSVLVSPSLIYIGGTSDPVKQAQIRLFVRYKD